MDVHLHPQVHECMTQLMEATYFSW
jgi:hypothetical protein